MLALDMLGAGEGLSTQAIIVRVKKVDAPKLRKSLEAGAWGAAISPALAVVDQFPQLAIDIALPIATKQLEGMGITADLTSSNNPPPPRPPAESRNALIFGAAAGLALGALLSLGGTGLYHLLTRKRN